MPKRVGIDLGTTYSCVAYVDEMGLPTVCKNRNGKSTTPSVVAIKDGHTVVGEEAVELGDFGLAPAVALFKREMGNPDYLWGDEEQFFTAPQLSAEILKSLCDDVEMATGERPQSAVVTVPAYFKDVERTATQAAMKIAGLEEIQLINEPTAAANAWRNHTDANDGLVLVFDLGGGTFDVTLLEYGDLRQVLGSHGDNRLGGADWDQRLADHISTAYFDEYGEDLFDDPDTANEFPMLIEGLKKDLTVKDAVPVSFSAHNQRFSITISREEFEEMTVDLVERTISLTDDLLDELAETKFQDLGRETSDITTVLLVGGSTRMPMIHRALENRFGFAPNRSINPDEAVALGAALLAESREGNTSESQLSGVRGTATELRFTPISDVTNHSLGMVAVSHDRSEYVNSIIIGRHQSVPCEDLKPYQHYFTDQHDELEIYLTQGESEHLSEVGIIGRYVISNLPGTEYRRKCVVEIGYSYNESSVISVRARQRGTIDWVNVPQSELPGDVPERFFEKPEQQVVREHLSVLAFVDVSGSMSGSPIKKAREALRELVNNFDLSHVSVGVGVVSDKSKVLLKPTQNAKDVEVSIEKVEVGITGGGNEGHPFDDIRNTLRGWNGVRAAVVLADGQWYNQEAAIKAAQRCHKEGITIASVGFGSADEKFLADIASVSDLSTFTSESGLLEAFGNVAQVLSDRTDIRAG